MGIGKGMKLLVGPCRLLLLIYEWKVNSFRQIIGRTMAPPALPEPMPMQYNNRIDGLDRRGRAIA